VIIEAGLILSRFLHYSCVLAIFGISLFPLYTKTDRLFPSHEFRRWRQKALLISTGVGIVSAIAWFVFTAAVMADGFLAALDMSTFDSASRTQALGRFGCFGSFFFCVSLRFWHLAADPESSKRVCTLL
jgi:putative copper resistance protein D